MAATDPSSSAPPPAPPPPPPAQANIWVTLRHRSFRSLWIASAAYFIANAMYGMAASWLMVELTGSSFLAALVQTAVFLPMFVLALPAGESRDLLLTMTYAVVVFSILVQGLTIRGVTRRAFSTSG